MQLATEIFLWILYLIPAAILMLFGFNLYFMLGLYSLRRRRARRVVRRIMEDFKQSVADKDLPLVVTQLPIYNEYNVIERALRAVAAIDYPMDRHVIQVLDDSNDETGELVDRIAADLIAQGHRIEVLRRPDRIGFKAGALDYGMQHSNAEFFAIFDADFVPPRDFLRRSLPVLLMREDVGLVQARWGHLNADSSVVTRAQGLGIDGHFAIEQSARAWNKLFMNFNGTAGLWRRRAIVDAGGWEHDTLTEDMDLSYRSQLSGWAPFFLPDLVVPAELPEDINAFKAQQFRWAKGSIQTAIKLLPRVMRSPASRIAKVQAVFHMTHYIIHPVMVWLALFALPILCFTHLKTSPWLGTILFSLIILSALAPMTLYAVAQISLYAPGRRRFRLLPLLSVIGVGIAISNSRAVIEALLGKESPFVRTPKRGDSNRVRYKVRMPYVALLEVALGMYCFVSSWVYLNAETYVVGPFLILYALGFTSVGVLSLAHAFSDARWGRAPKLA